MRRRQGFTLIELLVVIAIIAILAAMLFPVFARARESARKIQCLSNVKNIATAIQMYLTDYDRFPPGSHDAGLQEWADTGPGRGRPRANCWRVTGWGNPFLRWPVVFDEYVKNRDVWRCPSARWSASIWFIVPDYGPGPWWHYLRDHVGEWGTGKAVSPCAWAFPPGWGGDVTDSIAQQRLASPEAYGWITGVGQASGACFEETIGCTEVMDTDLKTSQIQDPSWHIVCADNGGMVTLHNIRVNLYGMCSLWGCADWENCPISQDCGLDADACYQFWHDASYRSKFTRHMGGSNLGFADGHAAWWHAEQVRSQHERYDCCCNWVDGKLSGMCYCNAPTP